MTTFLPTTRTMLGMASYRALPARFASIHPKFKTPGFNTIVAGCVAGAFYTVLFLVSEAVLTDTILSLGLMICFYYGLTAFASAWYFRKELNGVKAFLLKGVAPVLGGTLSLLLFLAVLASSASSLQTTFIAAARTILAMSVSNRK